MNIKDLSDFSLVALQEFLKGLIVEAIDEGLYTDIILLAEALKEIKDLQEGKLQPALPAKEAQKVVAEEIVKETEQPTPVTAQDFSPFTTTGRYSNEEIWLGAEFIQRIFLVGQRYSTVEYTSQQLNSAFRQLCEEHRPGYTALQEGTIARWQGLFKKVANTLVYARVLHKPSEKVYRMNLEDLSLLSHTINTKKISQVGVQFPVILTPKQEESVVDVSSETETTDLLKEEFPPAMFAATNGGEKFWF